MSDQCQRFFVVLLLACFISANFAGSVGKSKSPSATTILADNLPGPDLAGAWSDLLTLVNAHRGDTSAAIAKLKSYFKEFGYLQQKNSSTESESESFDEALESAVKLYQQNFRLPVTGALDSTTVAQIVKPRCGREDVNGDGTSQMLNAANHSTNVVKRYSFFPGGPRWVSKNRLTYAFDESKIPPEPVKAAFRRSFQRWAAVVPLSFAEAISPSAADIVIEFVGFAHQDSNPFDGPLGVLAHAFSPEDGRFHLDSSEKWSTDLKSDKGLAAIHLESVAVHEIGHLIGLGHSGEAEAIMYPSIGPRQVKLDLAQDDIAGAQALYGANPNYKPGVPISVTDSNSQASSAAAPRFAKQQQHRLVKIMIFMFILFSLFF